MGKQITFEHNGSTYTLEFNRAAMIALENDGVVLKKAEEMPITTIYKFFKAALVKHHPKMTEQMAQELFEEQGDLFELMSDLSDMFKDSAEKVGEVKRKKNW